MRRGLAWVPLLGLSLVLFVAAGLARSDDQAILLALAGAAVPAVALIAMAVRNVVRWHRMGRKLGLLARQSGAFPDLEGRYQGRRLVILRRTNVYGIGPRLTTVIKLEGCPEVRLPGLVADAATVRQLIEPLLKA